MNNSYSNNESKKFNFGYNNSKQKKKKKERREKIEEEEYIDMGGYNISDCRLESMGPNQLFPHKSIFHN